MGMGRSMLSPHTVSWMAAALKGQLMSQEDADLRRLLPICELVPQDPRHGARSRQMMEEEELRHDMARLGLRKVPWDVFDCR